MNRLEPVSGAYGIGVDCEDEAFRAGPWKPTDE